LRLILIVAAVISGAVAGAVGCGLIDVDPDKALLIAVGWLGWTVCLLAAASLPWEVRVRRWWHQ
jgi:ABC-type uncharacterized transport system permease subunit